MRRDYETMHCEKYEGKVNEDKVMQMKSALSKQRRFSLTNISQCNEDLGRSSFAVSEMIAKSSRPFYRGFVFCFF